MSTTKLLQMENIYKEFPGVVAVDNVSISIKHGEVLGLLGENGAGKSTLIKILSGAIKADKGTILLEGKKITNFRPKDTLGLGIAVIYQELNYLNDMSVAENIFLGHLPTIKKTKKIDYVKLYEMSYEIQKEVGIENISPKADVRDLSVAEKQLLEIGRAYARNVKIMVMDEPTSALNDKEIEVLFKLINKMKMQGIAIIYISHKLEEIHKITDRVYVMRDGKAIYDGLTKNTTSDQIISNMVGRKIQDMYPVKSRNLGDTVLEVSNLNTEYLKDVSLNLKRGEIVGLFGLMGSGCDDIAKSIFGYQNTESIDIKVDGKPIQVNKPFDAINNGITYIPNERKSEGLILNHSVERNTTITNLELIKTPISIDTKKEKNIVLGWIKKLGIKTPSKDTIVDSLSGGNQQKVVLAKWLNLDPKVIIMNEPTKGIDVGAKVEIYKLMNELCSENLSVLMVSSEMPEMLGVADRIIVVRDGKIVGEFLKNEASQEKLMNCAIRG